MENPAKLATLGTQGTWRRKTKTKTSKKPHHYPQTNTNNV